MPNTESSIYDDYDITDIIGEGTFSSVTLATHRKSGKRYAVKIIDKECINNSQRREMVDWEIAILSKCRHPNIVEFYEHFESDQDICLVLEWIPNGDLFDRIVKKGVFTEEESRLTMKSLFSAVDYLHERSLVHRDLKPENILFNSEEGDVKLADFGLSKYYEESVGMESACGTPAYSAPEINNNKVYRKGVDMWSCGCILYFILFGKPPFYHNDESEIYKLVSTGKWSFPSNQHEYSDDVKDMIRGLLEHDPAKRLTAKKALSHRWITQVQQDPSPLLSSVPSPLLVQSREINNTSSLATTPDLQRSLTLSGSGSSSGIGNSNYLTSSNSGIENAPPPSPNKLRGSNSSSTPIPIKKHGLLRSSLNSSIEAHRFNALTPPRGTTKNCLFGIFEESQHQQQQQQFSSDDEE
ncbi:putative protein serine/threonine kinase [Heterostelium album PN500]|uniref:non-specific serine/threonine protein kinase n=1 Tax=Heterostelium pallidum (strain ATCC 26659 / Pp 5 / PN500) TaxID=670386 RepID=D3BN50_HETP5|nr:putative protein serine/threonine kinase [Heterostelium album PN500]EFA77412.1 putative protein serine/threonine kinase [Heterostelium album PN500]|eukprot:XP_020429541.1 putative protein serine/threonine kinase [Heterostelium album PN500]